MTKPAITRVSNLEITPSSTNNNNGFYPPQLTTDEIAAIPAGTVQHGGIVYNTTTGFLQTYTSGNTWVNLYAGVIVGDVVVASHTTNAQPGVQAGLIYYDTDTDNYLGSNTTDYLNFYYSISDATGVGLADNNYPFTLPTGTSVNVENNNNEVVGFMYYNGTGPFHTVRVFLAPGWQSVYASPSAATGVGLLSENPFTLPSGPAGTTEEVLNEVVGFMYYDTTVTNSIRTYVGTAWESLYSSPSAATGDGLADNNYPFTFPSGARVGVEVAGNQVAGFAYYDTTNNVFRVRTNAAWVTVQTA